ncbi:MAG: cupin-like domain-containing protein [Vicinamibacteria bacterium]|nr:cupin-like domain-containing protein [Vicinamibacteria bacterium]
MSLDVHYSLTSVPIERVAGVDRVEFERQHLNGVGRPVIVTDAMRSWAATETWSFDFFADRYGEETVIVTDRLAGATRGRRCKLGDFMVYSRFPALTSLAAVAGPTPFYLTSFSPFARHPELLRDFDEPYFVDNALRELQGPLWDWYVEQFSWIFIGPPGTLSPLHVDLFGTHAWLAQVCGRKHFLLYSPADRPYLYGGAFDPDAPDLERFPLLPQARPIEAVLEPGEVIAIPRGWAHRVIALEPAISLTFNFVNRSNLASHLVEVGRNLPLWARKLQAPGFREGSGATWGPDDLAGASRD